MRALPVGKRLKIAAMVRDAFWSIAKVPSYGAVIFCAVIQREAAIPVLQPLAKPTLKAFASAQATTQRMREAAGSDLILLDRGVAGIVHGVDFWGFFAGHLQKNFQGLATRDAGTSDQRHRWLVADGSVCIHLKSDVDQLCSEQLMLEHFPDVGTSGQPALIALTWTHLGVDRYHPTFVHLEGGSPRWELPLKELVESNLRVLRPQVPNPVIRLRRRRGQESAGGAE
jgi:hypothetical protein